MFIIFVINEDFLWPLIALISVREMLGTNGSEASLEFLCEGHSLTLHNIFSVTLHAFNPGEKLFSTLEKTPLTIGHH